MKTIVCGAGEVGKSLYSVLLGNHEVYLRDVEPNADDPIDVVVLNICFPPSDKFEDKVREYQKRYHPAVTIIHSTVPVGTTRRLGAVHSPIHGRHPDLAEGIKTFTKYLGGEHQSEVEVAKLFLEQAGIKVRVVSSPEASEFSKIQCTTHLGWDVLYMKWVEQFCKKEGINFEEVWGWHKHYNEGYAALGEMKYTRPLLVPQPGPIGGHCVVNNCKLMPGETIPSIILEADKSF